MALLLEVRYGDKWYPLQVPKSVLQEVEFLLDFKEDDWHEGYMIHVSDFPALTLWMNKNFYSQDLVSVSHFPEVMDA